MNLLLRFTHRATAFFGEIAQLVIEWMGGGNGDPDRLRAANSRRARSSSSRSARSATRRRPRKR
ncbi:hypothetical protein [Cryobacterium arcticum]|uniref:Uncharacterized protein n=1 Tax=Cryobacterium arcticum TaxID=670052 RepID=A0A317ZXM4_9MICO|nr:hypothetical protein [Cryobacterium arcticum]PXA71985.1 hypothetical protein CTB96_03475 [Cryobacterium arcticum]